MAGFPGGASDKESACQCRKCKRHTCDPWVCKIPWSRKWQPTSVYLPGKITWAEEPGGLQCMGLQNQMQLSTPLLDIDIVIMLPNNFCYFKHLNMFNVMRIVWESMDIIKLLNISYCRPRMNMKNWYKFFSFICVQHFMSQKLVVVWCVIMVGVEWLELL